MKKSIVLTLCLVLLFPLISAALYRKKKVLWFSVWERVETKYFGPYKSKYEVYKTIEHS